MPPDDTGSKTFGRYCYQAHVAFPFCLECALGGQVVSVVAEHIEDLAIEYDAFWRFLQVKTREPTLGPWRLSDLTGSDGGLRSLLRSYRALREAHTSHELFLEGPIDRRDDVRLLTSPDGRRDPALQERLCRALEIEPEECSDFLDRVQLNADVPARQGIVDRNLRYLGGHATDLPFDVLCEIYQRIVARVEAAMALDFAEPAWYVHLLHPDAAESARIFLSKRLHRDLLRPLIHPLGAPPRPLLTLVAEPDSGLLAAHEEKLVAGGASQQIRQRARQLRAQAASIEFELAESMLYPDALDRLEDVRARLRIIVEGLLELHSDARAPAVAVWNELIVRLPQMLGSVDPDRVFRQDAFLLLGEICQLADMCVTHWGNTSAQ